MAVVFSSAASLRSDVAFSTPSFFPPFVALFSFPTPDQDDDNQKSRVARFPKRRYRWQQSKGDGPGEYGGPPIDFRIRRTWGEQPKDPLSSRDDYIWNKEWRNHLNSAPSTEAPPETDAGVGFLSLNRAFALDSIDIDLSQELSRPAKSIVQSQVEALRKGFSTDEALEQEKPRWRMSPTRREEKEWKRARKEVGMAVLVSDGSEAQEKRAVGSATARQDYLSLKKKLQLLTAVFGVAGVGVAYLSYSTEVAVSYGIGLLGALTYLRMLGNSVDTIGKSDAEGAIRGALSQPRLLVPVVLVMFFNRWNNVLAPEYGLVHLQLMPVLVGFFTYKAATVAEVLTDILQGSGE